MSTYLFNSSIQYRLNDKSEHFIFIHLLLMLYFLMLNLQRLLTLKVLSSRNTMADGKMQLSIIILALSSLSSFHYIISYHFYHYCFIVTIILSYIIISLLLLSFYHHYYHNYYFIIIIIIFHIIISFRFNFHIQEKKNLKKNNNSNLQD